MNADKTGTKCAAVHSFSVKPRSHVVVCCRLHHVSTVVDAAFGKQFDAIFCLRRQECHEFYSQVSHISVPFIALSYNALEILAKSPPEGRGFC